MSEEKKNNLAALKRKVTSLVKKFTEEIKSEGEKYGILLDVAIKIEEQKKE